MSGVKRNVASSIVNEKGNSTLKRMTRLMVSRLPNQGATEVDFEGLVSDREWVLYQSAVIVDETMAPAYFYGKRLTDTDISDFSSERGDVNRYKVLTRAPFFMMQVVNVFSHDPIPDKVRQTWHRRNTEYALAMNLAEYEKRIDDLLKTSEV